MRSNFSNHADLPRDGSSIDAGGLPRAKDADTALFLRLLTQHERLVYAYILSLISNWADADEILQETNVRLWNEFGRFTHGSDFAAWACTIARFQVLTWRKRKGRERIQFGDAFLKAVSREAAAVADDTSEKRAALAHCIEQLTPVNRELLRAYYASEARAPDVAKQFKRSVGALYQAVLRIRHVLQSCIDQQIKETA
jgi:RNA polymerase sigma-70 factor, ECF subfamily